MFSHQSKEKRDKNNCYIRDKHFRSPSIHPQHFLNRGGTCHRTLGEGRRLSGHCKSQKQALDSPPVQGSAAGDGLGCGNMASA